MDINLHYIEKGAGPALVLLHGNGESADYFAAQIDYFSVSYRVIAVDTRGHGLSPRGTGPFTLGRFADDLKDFLDGLGIRQLSLLGFSDGGNIALIFALRHPGYVKKLILNGANLNPAGMKFTVWLPIFMNWGLSSLTTLFSRSAVRRKEFLALMLKEPHIHLSELSTVNIPVLVIVGSRDMIRRRHTEQISLSLKHGSLMILPGTHFIAAENSGAFNSAVFRFLSE